jgi:dipeptidyl aminopeptidase/acylaminoacyl peptidase
MTITRRHPLLAASLLLTAALAAQAPATQLAPGADTANPTPVPTRAITPSGVALSPDGTSVTYAVGGRRGGGLHVITLADKSDKGLAPSGPAGCSSSDPVWSPDSQTLAFTSTCYGTTKTEQEQIILWSKSTGEFKQLTHLKGNLEQLAWSPDGNYIAFLFVENATRSAGALDAMKPWDGVIGEDNVEIQGVYSVSVKQASGVWMVYPNRHQYVYEFAWGPHKEMAVVAADAPGENNWWKAKLYSVDWHRNIDTDSNGTHDSMESKLHLIFDPNTTTTALHGLQIAVPRYSPDGKQIAFIGGLMSDQGSTGGDIYTIPTTGGQPTDITPNIDGTPSYFVWINDNRIGIVEDRRGRILLPDYDVAKRAYIEGSVIDLGEVSISGGPIKDAVAVSNPFKSFALVQSSYKLAPEVYIGTASGITQLTHLNAGTPQNTHKVESIEWKNEGFDVQGWLTYPVNYDPAKKYPMIVTVHGGPSASAGPPRSFAWSDLGYFELSPNPRGSFGQGEKFVQANIKDFGYGDLSDILAGVDAVEKKVSIDDHRLGLTGWSYGGFMSMFAETHTHRFASIVAGAGISDWKSYYGENSIDQWMVPFFGATVYDDPAVYARSSAIEFIKNAKTPMLIIVGDRDGECPAPQSFEMWHALKAEGVTTQLVIYPNEGHGFRDPKHIADRAKRSAEWFAKYMPASRE